MLLFCSLCGAENGTRTRDPDLGKVVLYQLSYFRLKKPLARTISLDCGCKGNAFHRTHKIFKHFFAKNFHHGSHSSTTVLFSFTTVLFSSTTN